MIRLLLRCLRHSRAEEQLGAGSWEREAGSGKREAGSGKREAGSWKPTCTLSMREGFNMTRYVVIAGLACALALPAMSAAQSSAQPTSKPQTTTPQTSKPQPSTHGGAQSSTAGGTMAA